MADTQTEVLADGADVDPVGDQATPSASQGPDADAPAKGQPPSEGRASAPTPDQVRQLLASIGHRQVEEYLAMKAKEDFEEARRERDSWQSRMNEASEKHEMYTGVNLLEEKGEEVDYEALRYDIAEFLDKQQDQTATVGEIKKQFGTLPSKVFANSGWVGSYVSISKGGGPKGKVKLLAMPLRK